MGEIDISPSATGIFQNWAFTPYRAYRVTKRPATSALSGVSPISAQPLTDCLLVGLRTCSWSGIGELSPASIAPSGIGLTYTVRARPFAPGHWAHVRAIRPNVVPLGH